MQPYRKRMRRREVPGGDRFITFSCQRRLPLLLRPGVAQSFVHALARVQSSYGLQLFAWVVMPEHIHVACELPKDTTLESILRRCKMSVSKRWLEHWKHADPALLLELCDQRGRPRFWQRGGGFDRNIRSNTELAGEIRYIHHNPVRRGLVARPEDWRWSSATWWMGRDDCPLPCTYPRPASAWSQWSGFI